MLIKRITCNTQGTITVGAQGGTAPYLVGMDTLLMRQMNQDSTYTYQGLDDGSFTFIVRDHNGCWSDSVTTSIQNLANINVDLTITDANCDDANGKLSFSYIYGVMSYKLTIVNMNTSQVVHLDENVMNLVYEVQLPPGLYEIAIDDHMQQILVR